jgi:hypothetical protein
MSLSHVTIENTSKIIRIDKHLAFPQTDSLDVGFLANQSFRISSSKKRIQT